MSQIGVFQNNAPVGSGIAFLKGDNVGNVGPDVNDIVKILGGAGIVVTGDPANNELTIDSTVAASLFHPDDGNDAAPHLNILDILGTANQIRTIGIPIGGPYTGIGIQFTTDVTIPRDLTITRNIANVIAITATGNISGNSITATTNGIDCTGLLTTHTSINNTGDITSSGTTTLSALNHTGVVQTSATGVLSSSNGANGTLLIGGGIAPNWAALTTDGTIIYTPGANSLSLRVGDGVPTLFRDKAGAASFPIGNTFTITGDANVRTTSGLATMTISLSPNVNISGALTADTVTSTGLMTASNTLSVTTGNITLINGNIVVNTTGAGGNITTAGTITSNFATGGFISNADVNENAFFTPDADYRSTNGYIILDNGNITATAGIITGAHLVATTDLTLPVITAIPRTIIQDNTGLIVPTNGTDGQVLMADAVTGVAFGNLAAGPGIALTYNSGTRTRTITNTGVGGVKTIFKAGFNSNVLNATGDGFTYVFNTMTSIYQTVPCFNTGSPSYFEAPINGYYQFFMNIDLATNTAVNIEMKTEGFFIKNGVTYDCTISWIGSNRMLENSFICSTTAPMNQFDRMTFAIKGFNYAPSGIHRTVSINALYTSISGFQIS